MNFESAKLPGGAAPACAARAATLVYDTTKCAAIHSSRAAHQGGWPRILCDHDLPRHLRAGEAGAALEWFALRWNPRQSAGEAVSGFGKIAQARPSRTGVVQALPWRMPAIAQSRFFGRRLSSVASAQGLSLRLTWKLSNDLRSWLELRGLHDAGRALSVAPHPHLV